MNLSEVALSPLDVKIRSNVMFSWCTNFANTINFFFLDVTSSNGLLDYEKVTDFNLESL